MASPGIVSVPEQVADHIRLGIWSGRFRAGERLREEQLAEQLGVSRGPIRDTFLRLTREGLLEAKPNVGVRVADVPSEFKRKTLVQVRRTIECNALDRTMRAGGESLVGALKANLKDYRRACRAESLEDVVVLDMAFHRAIVQAADEGSLLATWTPVISQMFLKYSRHHSLMESFEEHAAIVEAIGDDDRRGATRALREHIV